MTRTIVMAQLSPQKRKKRRIQLREAQRRRRARLKEDAKSFLQIILDQKTLDSLRSFSESRGRPLHLCAADLIRNGLATSPAPAPTVCEAPRDPPAPYAIYEAKKSEDLEKSDSIDIDDPVPVQSFPLKDPSEGEETPPPGAENSHPTEPHPRNQMELFIE